VRFVLIGPVYPYRGGIAHYTTLLQRALCERGHDVLLVSFKRQYPRWLFPGVSDRDPSEEPVRARAPKYWLDPLDPLTWLTTLWRMRRFSPDVTVLQWWTTFWTPAWFVVGIANRLVLRRSLIYICHNVLPHEARRWDPWLARLALRWGTCFVVHSTEERNRLQTLVKSTNIKVSSLPALPILGSERMPKEEARSRLGLPSDALILLFFGIVREYKGLSDVLRALPETRVRIPNVLLVVAGEFWEAKESYLELIQQLGIGDAVRIDDRYIPNEEALAYFSAADALVAPYRQVTGSAVMRVANALNLPIVHSIAVANRAGSQPADDATLPLADQDRLDMLAWLSGSEEDVDPSMRSWLQGSVPTWETLVRQLEAGGGIEDLRQEP
jgi:glycosyltransferase involved in cell wall biosynthesis